MFWLLGMPNVLLWGALVACLEFVPYLGALTAVVVFTLAGLSAFPDLAHALLVPGSFLAINLLQANVVTPLLLGHRLTLNPVAIFIGLAFFFWIWGVPGAFLAVPLLATFKIFCDHIESLAAIGEFLGQRDEERTSRDGAVVDGVEYFLRPWLSSFQAFASASAIAFASVSSSVRRPRRCADALRRACARRRCSQPMPARRSARRRRT